MFVQTLILFEPRSNHSQASLGLLFDVYQMLHSGKIMAQISKKSTSVVLLEGRRTCPPTEHKVVSVTHSTLNGISYSRPVPIGENAVGS